MPLGQPLVGETWVTGNGAGDGSGTMLGVVSEVIPNIITLVSLTGNRVRVSPDRLRQGWSFATPRPRTPYRCENQGCTESAVFEHTSPVRSQVRRCPRHMPVGIQAVLLLDDPTAPLSMPMAADTASLLLCPLCHRDRLVEQRVDDGDDATDYRCEGCGSRMTYFECSEERNIGAILRPVALVVERRLRRADIAILVGRRVQDQILRQASTSIGPIPGTVEQYFQGIPFELNGETPEWGCYIVPAGSRHGVVAGTLTITAQEGNPFNDPRHAGHPPSPILPGRPISPIQDSSWVNRRTGSLVTVTRSTGMAVHFRGHGETACWSVMTLEDFHQYHRVAEDRPNRPTPTLNVTPGEEWDTRPGSNNSQIVKIVKVDKTLGTVTLDDGGELRTQRIADMVHGRWEKVVRRSAFDRLLSDSDFD